MTPSRGRRGFTLLELMLALAVLVALAATAWPLLTGSLSSARLRSGADQVRAAWGRARVEAMQSGSIHVFYYEPDSGRFTIDRWEADDAELESSGDDAGADAATNASAVDAQTDVLPERVLFVGSSTEEDARAAGTAGAAPAGDTSGAAWDPPILFYPDGTTTTAKLTISGENQRRIVLTLRGLTGVVTVSDILSADDSAAVSD